MLKTASLILSLSVVDAVEFSARVIVGSDEAHEPGEISLIVKLEAIAVSSLLCSEYNVGALTEVLNANGPLFKT